MCFKCMKSGHYSNKCPEDGEEKGKNGSSFLVLNTQDSSDDETKLTINHDHLMEVQGNDSGVEDSDEDVEEGNAEGNTDEDEELETESEDDYSAFAFTQQDLLCSIQDKAGISGS